MDSSDHNSQETAQILNQLKWLLVGYRLSGATHFPSGVHPSSESTVSHSQDFLQRDPQHDLEGIRAEIGDCRRCRLHEGRAHIVFGEGSPVAPLVFVGEGPGFDEDRHGRPFVGRAGKLLDKMIESLGMGREEVYICNVVKCRPPNNRTPNPDEIGLCSLFLMEQLSTIAPRVICTLGSCATQTLLGTATSISRMRGRLHHWRGIPLMCTYHPAYLLRNPSQKAATWQDLRAIHRLLHEHKKG